MLEHCYGGKAEYTGAFTLIQAKVFVKTIFWQKKSIFGPNLPVVLLLYDVVLFPRFLLTAVI
jgi:hypothetical protein